MENFGCGNYYSQNNDTIYIVNFWSTYCQPCIEEMPYLQSISKKYVTKKITTHTF